jgi:hypothetical protein
MWARLTRGDTDALIAGLVLYCNCRASTANPEAELAGDLVSRQFAVTVPDRPWLAK